MAPAVPAVARQVLLRRDLQRLGRLAAAGAGRRLSYWVDRCVIDGLVNLVGRVPRGRRCAAAVAANRMVQFYALAMVLGLVVLIVTLLVWPAIAASME